MQFTLSTLYDEYQKHRNTWSKSNVDLELVRYLGCSFRLYREKDCDFIFRYNRKFPFTDSQLTGPSLHPGILMTQRKKRIVKSYSTKPRGRASIRVKMKPPTLFQDRWYFQSDLCKTPLISIAATACNLRFPFGSPQTDNTCIYFQVLSKRFNTMLSISPDYPKNNWTTFINYLKTNIETNYDSKKKGTLDNYNDRERLGVVFNTFMTEEHIFDPSYKDKKNTNDTTTVTSNKYNNYSSLWGDYIYKKEIVEAFKSNAQNYFNARKGTVVTSNEYLNHKTGLFSPIFLSIKRLSPDFPGFYQEVIYNPANDKGIGNKVWMDWCTKNDSTWRDTNSKLPVVDIPLWAALQGYSDYCTKYYNDPGLIKEARVTIICPYTQPPLTDRDNTDMGFVPYDYNFGNGLMPDGQGYIPIDYRFRWYPCMFHQQNWMNDMVGCGPFAYQGDQKKVVLTCKYKFHFLFGGNPISQQTLKDPCKQPTFQIPGSGGVPPRLQIENPKRLSEGFYFRAWDIRRGLFGKHAIKRVQEQPYDAEYFAGPPKKSKFEVPAMQNEDYISEGERWPRWPDSRSTSSTPSHSESEQEETAETPHLKQQLKQQLREQKQIKKEVGKLIEQLIKTQLNLHAPLCQP